MDNMVCVVSFAVGDAWWGYWDELDNGHRSGDQLQWRRLRRTRMLNETFFIATMSYCFCFSAAPSVRRHCSAHVVRAAPRVPGRRCSFADLIFLALPIVFLRVRAVNNSSCEAHGTRWVIGRLPYLLGWSGIETIGQHL